VKILVGAEYRKSVEFSRAMYAAEEILPITEVAEAMEFVDNIQDNIIHSALDLGDLKLAQEMQKDLQQAEEYLAAVVQNLNNKIG
jgi:uncharacterized protein with PhoU and TrkA domain